MSRYVKDSNGNWQLSAGLPQIDDKLDATSENPVQNKVIVEGMSPIVNVLGAKNLLPNNATSRTIANVQFTVNLDGSVVADGTASDSANAVLALSSNVPVKKGRYLLTGCPSGGGIDKYILSISGIGSDKGDGYELNLTEDTTLTFNIIVYKSITVSNITFKPMLRPASVVDDTYVPYTMTNRGLTNDLNDSSLSSVTSSYGTIEGGYKKIGKIVIVNIRLTVNTSISSGTFIIEGLPAATGTLNKVAVTTSVQQTTAILNGTSIQLITTQPLTSGTILILSATYVSNN